MLKLYTVAFFGHRYISSVFRLEELLEKHIRELLTQNEYVDFLVGCNGEFDQCVSSVILRTQKRVRDDNSSLTLVLPYDIARYRNNKEYFENYYSDIQISYKASAAHPKSAIQIRNREMVDRADLVICYIENQYGGAWQTVQYALKQQKTVINLAEFI